MGLNLNFTGVEAAAGFEPLPEGNYSFIIESAELKAAGTGSSENLILKLQVAEGEQQGKTALQYINIQESTMPFVKAFFNALAGEEVEDVNMEVSDLVGNSIGGVVTHKKDGDKTYANVGSWFTA